MSEPLSVAEFPGRIVLTLTGPLTDDCLDSLEKSIARAKELIKRTYEETGKGAHVLFDLTNFDGTYDTEAMEALATFAKEDEAYVAKTAVFGAHGRALIAGKLTVALSGRKNFKFFPTEAEALAWLII